MIKRLYFISIYSSILLTGCLHPYPRSSEGYTGKYKNSTPISTYSGITGLVNFPELQIESKANVGQTIISSANLTKIEAVNVPSVSFVPEEEIGANAILNGGVLPLYLENEYGKFYHDVNNKMPFLVGVCVPSNKYKPTVVCQHPYYWIYGDKPIQAKETVIEKWNFDSFKRELIYAGISQNTISILYREFVDNMARPAFSQELKYDISQGKEIGYKSARFEIIKATNTELTYKVLKPLE